MGERLRDAEATRIWLERTSEIVNLWDSWGIPMKYEGWHEFAGHALDVFFGSEKRGTRVVTYPEECWYCNACVETCPEKGSIWLWIPMAMMVCYK